MTDTSFGLGVELPQRKRLLWQDVKGTSELKPKHGGSGFDHKIDARSTIKNIKKEIPKNRAGEIPTTTAAGRNFRRPGN